jgi:hypothetical protein
MGLAKSWFDELSAYGIEGVKEYMLNLQAYAKVRLGRHGAIAQSYTRTKFEALNPA